MKGIPVSSYLVLRTRCFRLARDQKHLAHHPLIGRPSKGRFRRWRPARSAAEPLGTVGR